MDASLRARGEWRVVLREAAAETLREARRAVSRYDEDRLREAAGRYAALAGAGFAEVAAVMLNPGERAAASNHRPQRRELGRVAAEVLWMSGPHGREGRQGGEGTDGAGARTGAAGSRPRRSGTQQDQQGSSARCCGPSRKA
jgi:hypothetical protein